MIKEKADNVGQPLTVESLLVVSSMAPLCLFLTPLIPSIGNDTTVKFLSTSILQGDLPFGSNTVLTNDHLRNSLFVLGSVFTGVIEGA